MNKHETAGEIREIALRMALQYHGSVDGTRKLAINYDAITNVDFGAKGEPIDPIAIFNQTGKLVYRSKDAEGNEIGSPVIDLGNHGVSVSKLFETADIFCAYIITGEKLTEIK